MYVNLPLWMLNRFLRVDLLSTKWNKRSMERPPVDAQLQIWRICDDSSPFYTGGAQSLFRLVREQHGPQNTSANHPSVAIVYQNHMWLWCLFIIMRMQISSVWLLAVWSGVCACALSHHSLLTDGQKLQVASWAMAFTQKLKLWICECQEFIIAIFVASSIEHGNTERTRNHFPLSAFCSRSD